MLAEDKVYFQLVFENSPEIDTIVQEIENSDYTKPIAVYKIDSSFINMVEAKLAISLNKDSRSLVSDRLPINILDQLNIQLGRTVMLAASVAFRITDSFIFNGLDSDKIYIYLYDSR